MDSIQLSSAFWTRTRRLAAERGHKVSRMKKLVGRCDVNRVVQRDDLSGDGYWASVEMMDSDDALGGL